MFWVSKCAAKYALWIRIVPGRESGFYTNHITLSASLKTMEQETGAKTISWAEEYIKKFSLNFHEHCKSSALLSSALCFDFLAKFVYSSLLFLLDLPHISLNLKVWASWAFFDKRKEAILTTKFPLSEALITPPSWQIILSHTLDKHVHCARE